MSDIKLEENDSELFPLEALKKHKREYEKNKLKIKESPKEKVQMKGIKKKKAPKISLDRVAHDLMTILGLLEKSKGNGENPDDILSKSMVSMKIQQKEFFKEDTQKKKALDNKKSQTMKKPSSNSLRNQNSSLHKTKGGKTQESIQKLDAENKIGHLKLKVADGIETFMQSALVKSEKENKVPEIDIGNFLVKSLQAANKILHETKNQNEQTKTQTRNRRELKRETKNDDEKESKKENEKTLRKTQSKTPSSKLILKSQTSSNLVKKSSRVPNSQIQTLHKNKLSSNSSIVNKKFFTPLVNTPASPTSTSRPASSRSSSICYNRTSSLLVGSQQRKMLSALPRIASASISTFSKRNDPIALLRQEVNRAIRNRKTFTVRGRYPAVRKALLQRGWVEKFHTAAREKVQKDLDLMKSRQVNQIVDSKEVKEMNDIIRRLIKSRMLGNHQVDFYWGTNLEAFHLNPDRVKLTKINKFRREVFSYTSKQGLSDAARNAHWFNYPGLAQLNHPRTYALAKNGETTNFIQDFYRTAAISLLKWVVQSYEKQECKILSNSGKIPIEAFEFAANECYKMIVEAKNQDIDNPIKPASKKEWTRFLEYYYKILHVGNHFKANENQNDEEAVVEKAAFLIDEVTTLYPYIKMDGTMNIWILKPAVGSQGKGIHICRTLQYIQDTVKTNSTTRYIVQKYIEKPLLIFNTKFDIRQWFLISSSVPLTIWMYKECYLRFSSQTYNLRKLHESVHLTNNSVQQRYKDLSHDITLPNYNMWDSMHFRDYLSNIGYPDIYWNTIYKGMKECIVGAVMVHQDKIDKRMNCFELYGADFMLTEDFQPWLIEINSCPALYASTPVTARMCPQVLEDTIKVVVDRARNPKARTGHFELVYRQSNVQCCKDNVNNMKVSGKPLPNNYFCNEIVENAMPEVPPTTAVNLLEISEEIPEKTRLTRTKSPSHDVRKTLQNLLRFIQDENEKPLQLEVVNTGIDPIAEQVENRKDLDSSVSLSFSNLKSQLNILVDSGAIEITNEDEKLINEALKSFKENRKNEFLRDLLEILERIVLKIPPQTNQK